jgi:hypothetical protein
VSVPPAALVVASLAQLESQLLAQVPAQVALVAAMGKPS